MSAENRVDVPGSFREEMKEEYHRYILRKVLFMLGCAISLIVLFGYALTIGSHEIDFFTVFSTLWNHIIGVTYPIGTPEWTNDYLLWEDRLPREAIAIVAGVGLAIGGAAMQSVVKNPLADPYTTGISSGAVLGVTIALALGITAGSITGNYGLVANAFLFGMIPTAVTIVVSRISKTSPATIILAGVAMSYLFNAMSTLILISSEAGKIQEAFLWQIGTLQWTTWDDFPLMFIIVAVGSVILTFTSKQLNILTLGDESAKSLGLNADNYRLLVLVVLSLMTSAVVSFIGIVGFLGLVSPHIVRTILGSDNKYVIPASAIFGALFLLAADLLARAAIDPGELPVGVIMSFIGGPLFLILILKSKKGVW
ncbi:iron ABC transporter permease protein [methanogenic archaeon mixed culture ISO4-G1]|nr:iron ABC transporter permease protein [methanogenic archaeon mixed culture ISO4-G1]